MDNRSLGLLYPQAGVSPNSAQRLYTLPRGLAADPAQQLSTLPAGLGR
jgi:hypothetical protein